MRTFLLLLLPLWPAAPAAVTTFSHRPIVAVGASKSNNWSGYNQGALEKGRTFQSISGTWTVPTASQHKAGEAEYSSSWIGIGGGCIDSGCSATDSTLIQTGTEQDVDASGKASYSAWWELVPAPSVAISNFAVSAGDSVHAVISQTAPEVWTISLTNVTRNQTFSTTVPYSSSFATAEWIEETPVVVGSNGAVTIGPLPGLSAVNFDVAQTNGMNANLVAAEELQLVDASGAALATPSAPDSDTDGFNDCTFAASCAVPAS